MWANGSLIFGTFFSEQLMLVSNQFISCKGQVFEQLGYAAKAKVATESMLGLQGIFFPSQAKPLPN
jgi:hypothetical protein